MNPTVAGSVLPLFAMALLVSTPLNAQVGDTSGINYPGWIPADGTIPTVTAGASFDTTNATWTYSYTVRNETGAQQDIEAVKMQFRAPETSPSGASAPSGWVARLYHLPTAVIPGVSFRAIVNAPAGLTRLPAAAQVAPGGMASGFSLTSAYPPGYARVYVKGYAALPAVSEEDFAAHPMRIPHDTTNSQRRWSVGPTQYVEVLSSGSGSEPYDGFLVLMSLRAVGTVMIDPAPIAVDFSQNGEEVFPASLSVLLNGTDVTADFHPGPADGADMVALFHLSNSPLLEGQNVMVTTIEGNDPITGQRVSDIDTIVFSVIADGSAPSDPPF